MAHPSVKINGVTYQEVPSIEVPLSTGSGNAEFYDTSDATLDSGAKMLAGNTSYADGTKYTGSIPTKSSSDLTASGATVSVPSGYYASQASKAVASGSAKTPATNITATPTITVDDDGLITANVSASQSVTPSVTAGYVSSGTAGTVSVSGSDTEQLTTQGAQTITPGTSAQTIPAGTYLTGLQTIEGDSDLQSANIKAGVSIFGVAGSLSSAVVSQDSTTKVLSIS